MKTCPHCQQQLSFESFNKNKTKKDGFQAVCRDCQAAYTQNHYQQNKALYIERAKKTGKEARKQAREFIDAAKDHPCMDCGVKYKPWQMDFDHLDPELKRMNVARLSTYSVKIIEAEIAKCELVCANCHRDRTHHRSRSG